jgi:hypothetical protein
MKFNDGSPVSEELFLEVCDELIKKFGGLTSSPPSSPAVGWWKDPKDPTGMLYKDDILIYRVSTIQDEDEFFKEYKKVLAVRFRQEEVLIERLETRQIG